MCEGCCCKEKSGKFLLWGRACSCILLSNTHASKKGCRRANLLLEELGSMACAVWWKWEVFCCFPVDVLLSVEPWVFILAKGLHHHFRSGRFLAEFQVLILCSMQVPILSPPCLGGNYWLFLSDWTFTPQKLEYKILQNTVAGSTHLKNKPKLSTVGILKVDILPPHWNNK